MEKKQEDGRAPENPVGSDAVPRSVLSRLSFLAVPSNPCGG